MPDLRSRPLEETAPIFGAIDAYLLEAGWTIRDPENDSEEANYGESVYVRSPGVRPMGWMDAIGEQADIELDIGRRFIVRYGQPGHEHEYCINIEGYSINEESIPQTIADELRRLVLPILNRGTRIEVVCQDIHYDEIVATLEAMGYSNDPEGKFLW